MYYKFVAWGRMKYIENHRPVSQQEFLNVIRSFGFEVVSSVMTNQRTGQLWKHQRVIQRQPRPRSITQSARLPHYVSR
jgi:acetolactate synthase regulatory subunit